MRIHHIVLIYIVSFFCSFSSRATIGSVYQMQLGNPSGAATETTNHDHFLIQHDQYAMDYNDRLGLPNWVSWDLTSDDVGSSGRGNFIKDPTLPAGFYLVGTSEYSGSGYDRGHMCPSADRTVTAADNQVVFYMSNMVPQAPDNNQGVWASFENYCRSLLAGGNELLITCGPSGFDGSVIPSGVVAIPGYVWKIVVVVPPGEGFAITRITADTRIIAIKVPNVAGVRNDPWQKYITSTSEIEADTGYSFLSELPASTRDRLRLVVDGQPTTGSPVIISQPVPQAVSLGDQATFSVTISGDDPLMYQWFKNETFIEGATASTYTIENAQMSDVGIYDVVVWNYVGAVTSNRVALTLNELPPSITTQPISQSVAVGSNVVFNIEAGGTAPIFYQWRKNGVELFDDALISGAQSTSLRIDGVRSSDAGAYDVVVTNAQGTAESQVASLTVTTASTSIILWDFTTAEPSSPLPNNINISALSQGNNNGTTALLTAISASSPTAFSGGNNAGVAARTGNLNRVDGGSAYFEVTLTPAVAKKLTLSAISFGSRSTGTGPQAYSIFTSADNYAVPVASGALVNNSTWVHHTPAFSKVVGGPGAAIILRIYGHNGSGSASANTANWRIDDLRLTVLTTKASCVGSRCLSLSVPGR